MDTPEEGAVRGSMEFGCIKWYYLAVDHTAMTRLLLYTTHSPPTAFGFSGRFSGVVFWGYLVRAGWVLTLGGCRGPTTSCWLVL